MIELAKKHRQRKWTEFIIKVYVWSVTAPIRRQKQTESYTQCPIGFAVFQKLKRTPLLVGRFEQENIVRIKQKNNVFYPNYDFN